MRKLKDDKKIKWRELYTDRTNFLKDMYQATVGEKSYWRFNGLEIEGPGEWYVVVSPAGVHDIESKWFAGIRKMPDTWPAGGKKFDSITDALTYANETWGSPIPKGVPHYTVSDLRGLASRINKWKAEREIKEEEKEDDKDGFVAVEKEGQAGAKLEKMASGGRGGGYKYRSPLAWMLQDFLPVTQEQDRQNDLNRYRDELRRNPRVSMRINWDRSRAWEALLAMGSQSIVRAFGFAKDEGQSSEGHIQAFMLKLASRVTPNPSPRPARVVDPETFKKVNEEKTRETWLPECLVFKKAVEEYLEHHGASPSQNYYLDEDRVLATDLDLRRSLAAIAAVIDRKRRKDAIDSAAGVIEVDDRASPGYFNYGNFEEALEEGYRTKMSNLQAMLVQHPALYDRLEGKEKPILVCLEYAREIRAMRCLAVAPYKSRRDWKLGFVIDEKFVEEAPELFGASGDQAKAAQVKSALEEWENFGLNIKRNKGDLVERFLVSVYRRVHNTSPDTDWIRKAMTSATGELMQVGIDRNKKPINLKPKTGAAKTRAIKSLGSIYTGHRVVPDGFRHGVPVQEFLGVKGGVDDILLAASPWRKKWSEFVGYLRENITSDRIARYDSHIGEKLDGPQAGEGGVVNFYNADAFVSPADARDALEQNGIKISSVDILRMFRTGGVSTIKVKLGAVRSEISKKLGESAAALAHPSFFRNDADDSADLSACEVSAALWMGNPPMSMSDIDEVIRLAAESEVSSYGESWMALLGDSGGKIRLRAEQLVSGTTYVVPQVQGKIYSATLAALYGRSYEIKKSSPHLYLRVLRSIAMPAGSSGRAAMEVIWREAQAGTKDLSSAIQEAEDLIAHQDQFSSDLFLAAHDYDEADRGFTFGAERKQQARKNLGDSMEVRHTQVGAELAKYVALGEGGEAYSGAVDDIRAKLSSFSLAIPAAPTADMVPEEPPAGTPEDEIFSPSGAAALSMKKAVEMATAGRKNVYISYPDGTRKCDIRLLRYAKKRYGGSYRMRETWGEAFRSLRGSVENLRKKSPEGTKLPNITMPKFDLSIKAGRGYTQIKDIPSKAEEVKAQGVTADALVGATTFGDAVLRLAYGVFEGIPFGIPVYIETAPDGKVVVRLPFEYDPETWGVSRKMLYESYGLKSLDVIEIAERLDRFNSLSEAMVDEVASRVAQRKTPAFWYGTTPDKEEVALHLNEAYCFSIASGAGAANPAAQARGMVVNARSRVRMILVQDFIANLLTDQALAGVSQERQAVAHEYMEQAVVVTDPNFTATVDVNDAAADAEAAAQGTAIGGTGPAQGPAEEEEGEETPETEEIADEVKTDVPTDIVQPPAEGADAAAAAELRMSLDEYLQYKTEMSRTTPPATVREAPSVPGESAATPAQKPVPPAITAPSDVSKGRADAFINAMLEEEEEEDPWAGWEDMEEETKKASSSFRMVSAGRVPKRILLNVARAAVLLSKQGKTTHAAEINQIVRKLMP